MGGIFLHSHSPNATIDIRRIQKEVYYYYCYYYYYHHYYYSLLEWKKCDALQARMVVAFHLLYPFYFHSSLKAPPWPVLRVINDVLK
jgi:hypothetical protein